MKKDRIPVLDAEMYEDDGLLFLLELENKSGKHEGMPQKEVLL